LPRAAVPSKRAKEPDPMDMLPWVVISVTALLALVAILGPYLRRSRGRGSVRASHARRRSGSR